MSAVLQRGWRLAVKRAFDRTVAVILLFVLLPVGVALSAIILISQGRPIMFSQMRPGLKARPFRLWKFRTMRESVGAGGALLPDGERLTGVGRWIRSSSLDEIPQLINVLKGELSLVGPRPLLMQYLPKYTPEQSRRHDVLPGITGWAQVNGRNAISWEAKFTLDVWYVDNWSLALDLRILLITVARVLTRSGVTKEGHATMPEFKGQEGRR